MHERRLSISPRCTRSCTHARLGSRVTGALDSLKRIRSREFPPCADLRPNSRCLKSRLQQPPCCGSSLLRPFEEDRTRSTLPFLVVWGCQTRSRGRKRAIQLCCCAGKRYMSAPTGKRPNSISSSSDLCQHHPLRQGLMFLKFIWRSPAWPTFAVYSDRLWAVSL